MCVPSPLWWDKMGLPPCGVTNRKYGLSSSRRRTCGCSSDKISSSNPRVIDDQRARQLCIDVRHSLFYETCATYGFNVDRVFSEGE